MVNADTTQQTVFILYSFKNSTSLIGNINKLLGTIYVVAPNFNVGYSSLRHASKYNGVWFANLVFSLKHNTSDRFSI